MKRASAWPHVGSWRTIATPPGVASTLATRSSPRHTPTPAVEPSSSRMSSGITRLIGPVTGPLERLEGVSLYSPSSPVPSAAGGAAGGGGGGGAGGGGGPASPVEGRAHGLGQPLLGAPLG